MAQGYFRSLPPGIAGYEAARAGIQAENESNFGMLVRAAQLREAARRTALAEQGEQRRTAHDEAQLKYQTGESAARREDARLGREQQAKIEEARIGREMAREKATYEYRIKSLGASSANTAAAQAETARHNKAMEELQQQRNQLIEGKGSGGRFWTLPNGTKVSHADLIRQYKVEHNIMDEWQIQMLEGQNPARAQFERDKSRGVMPFGQWAKRKFGIDVYGGYQAPGGTPDPAPQPGNAGVVDFRALHP